MMKKLLFFSLFVCFTITAQSQDAFLATWSGNNDDDWFTSGNWGFLGGDQIGPNTQVLISNPEPNPLRIKSGQNVECGEIIMNAAGDDVNATLIVQSGGSITVNGNFTNQKDAGLFTLEGEATVNGDMSVITGADVTVDNGTLTVTGNLDVTTGVFTMQGTSANVTVGTPLVPGSSENKAMLDKVTSDQVAEK